MAEIGENGAVVSLTTLNNCFLSLDEMSVQGGAGSKWARVMTGGGPLIQISLPG